MRALLVVLALAASVACGDKDGALRNQELGGSSLDSTNVRCKADSDCNTGEACGDGVCQMKRCGDASYASVSPLGAMGYFQRDRELVVVSEGTQLQGYDPEDRAFVRPNAATWDSTTGRIIDVAGGNLLGTRPEALVFATEASPLLAIQSGTDRKTIQLTFSPVALAVADVDADETDDIIAVSNNGKVAVCDAIKGTCQTIDATPPPAAGAAPTQLDVIDATAGDVDGDGYAEAVLLTPKSLVVVNLDTAKTGNTKVIEYPLDKVFTRIASGDLDGDGADDVVAILDGYLGDELHVFSLKGGTLLPKTMASTANKSVDLTVGMFGGRERPEVALLRSDNSTEMFALDPSGSLVSEYKGLLSGTNVTRIATADVNGDSPARRMVGKPKLIPGTVVPISVLTLPPYSRTHSEGRSSVSVGHESATGETKSDGTVFEVQAGLGFSQDFSVFAKIVSVEVEAHYNQMTYRTRGVTHTLTKSASFEIEAKPEMEGYDGGAVVLGCGCYHQYDYALDDPAHKMGADADGKVFSVFVPVDAQTTVWSTRRYNALVEALGQGKLPPIKIGYQLGQVASYPTSPVTLEGDVIAQRDMVFTHPPTLRSNDVAATSFELSVEREETNEELVYKGVGGSASLGVFGVTASGSVDVSWLKGYGVAVSQTSTFSGTVPPLRNDPTTPEDELKLYGYSFTPLLYRQRYLDGSGKEGAFLVLSYAVGK